MVKAVTRYEASDGSLHDDITEARKHDALYKRMAEVKTILMNPRMGNSPNMICLELTNNPDAATKLRDALNGVLNFHRTYGKLRKA